MTFSIDSSNTGAIDDALSIQEISDNIFEISVHITDLSSILKEDSILNEVAQKRC